MNKLVLNISTISLSIVCGIVFLYSAYSKLFPIEGFEYTLADTGWVSWSLSLLFARLLIGFEFACGILLVANLWLKRFTIPIVSFTLIMFSLYLLFMLNEYGNTGDCGCFGQKFPLTPLEGLVKNLFLMVAMNVLYFYHPHFSLKFEKYAAYGIGIIALALPFILNPMSYSPPKEFRTQEVNTPINLSLLYQDTENQPPSVELRKGKYVIAFMSLTCQHCKLGAKKLHIMKEMNPSLPIHLILNGDASAVKPFFEATRAKNLSWSLFVGAEKFLSLSAPRLPQIYLVNNSIIEKKCNYMTLEQTEIETWLKKH